MLDWQNMATRYYLELFIYYTRYLPSILGVACLRCWVRLSTTESLTSQPPTLPVKQGGSWNFLFASTWQNQSKKKKSLKTHLIQVIPSTPWNIKSERSKIRRELLHLQAMTGSAIQRQGERLCSRLVISLTHTFTTPLMLSKNDGVVNKKILAKTFTPCRTSTLHMGNMTANPVFPERVGGVRLTT